MDRLTVLCFAGTYGLAFIAELVRLALHAAGRWLWTWALISLGLAVQATYLANRGIRQHAVPITTLFESMLVLAGVLAAIALYLATQSTRRRPSIAVMALLGLTLVSLTVAGVWAPRGPTAVDRGAAISLWGGVHGIFQILGAVFTCLAFVFGLMYMAQSHRLKHKQPAPTGLILPSLEQSERWHRAAITIAFPMLTAGILTGIGLIFATRETSAALQWTDPKIWSTVALWVVFAILLHARYRPDWQGGRVMLLTIVAFAFMAFAMVGVGLIFPTRHGGTLALGDRPSAAEAAARGSLP